MWKKSDKWRPARTGTASGGGGVQDSESGAVGFAKSQFAYREKLASDLAGRIGVAVPKVVLDYVDGGANLHAISLAHGKESIDVPLLRERLANQFNSAEVQDAFKRASGLLPFHAWVATQDLKDEHLVVDVDSGGAYTVAAIDFAYSLTWEQPYGGPVQPPGAPASVVASVDKNVVETTVAKIEAVSDDEIRSFVNSLPGKLISDDEKRRVADGLIQRRNKVRETMKAQGWLP